MKIIKLYGIIYKIEKNIFYKWLAKNRTWIEIKKEELFLDNKIILERGKL